MIQYNLEAPVNSPNSHCDDLMFAVVDSPGLDPMGSWVSSPKCPGLRQISQHVFEDVAFWGGNGPGLGKESGRCLNTVEDHRGL